MFLQAYNLEPWATPLDDKDIVIKSLYFRVFKTDIVNEIHFCAISILQLKRKKITIFVLDINLIFKSFKISLFVKKPNHSYNEVNFFT